MIPLSTFRYISHGVAATGKKSRIIKTGESSETILAAANSTEGSPQSLFPQQTASTNRRRDNFLRIGLPSAACRGGRMSQSIRREYENQFQSIQRLKTVRDFLQSIKFVVVVVVVAATAPIMFQ